MVIVLKCMSIQDKTVSCTNVFLCAIFVKTPANKKACRWQEYTET